MGPSGCWPLASPTLWDVVLSLKISKAPPHWRRTFTSSHHNATDSTFPPIRISAPGRTNLPSLLTSRIFYHLSFLYHSSLLDHSHQQLTSVNSFILKKNKKHLVLNPHTSPANTTFNFPLYSKIPWKSAWTSCAFSHFLNLLHSSFTPHHSPEFVMIR